MSWTHMAVACNICQRRAPEQVRADFEQRALTDGVPRGLSYESREDGRGRWLMKRVGTGIKFACPDNGHSNVLAGA